MDVQTYLKEESERRRAVMQRLLVLGIGILPGTLIGLVAAAMMTPPNNSLTDRLFAWATVMGGPFVGTGWDIISYHPMLVLPGWLGFLLIPVHAVRPHAITVFVTLFGFLLWYYSGFVTLFWLLYAG